MRIAAFFVFPHQHGAPGAISGSHSGVRTARSDDAQADDGGQGWSLADGPGYRGLESIHSVPLRTIDSAVPLVEFLGG